ncbi:MerR family transcriptional regulator [Pseudalkalibacillus sp. R45]|uniref:MerR family transcriptional regulator n=1 Tax=Pseudalkalibacillus sp. R45 TaxID=3457433 RepID=UPI003FCE6215
MIIEDNVVWKVGELAELTGITVRTLRYYDQIGLLSPSYYSDSGYRLYDDRDLSRLQQILSLKDVGLSLEEIKGILSDTNYDPAEVVSLQIDRLKENIRIQQKLLKELQNVSGLMQTKEPLTVGNFTELFGMMKKSHEKFFSGRKNNMENHLDRLDDFLIKNQSQGRKNHD